jgi:hypothetical protein
MNTEINFELLYEKSIIEKNKLNIYIKELEIKINELENKNNDLTIHLKKYTASESHKLYYQKNKEKIIERNYEYNKQYKQNIDPLKIKEYNKRAYEKRKIKQQNKDLNI